jgi:hypothetical protein
VTYVNYDLWKMGGKRYLARSVFGQTGKKDRPGMKGVVD